MTALTTTATLPASASLAPLEVLQDDACLSVDTSQICVDEVEREADRLFLVDRGSEILRIEARAAHAISSISSLIGTRANIAKGREIALIQDHFRGRGDGSLPRFYESLGFSMTTATRYANAWRASQELEGLLGDSGVDGLSGVSDLALAKIHQLPSVAKQEIVSAIAAGDEPPSVRQVERIAHQPETKLAKAQERLEEARERLEANGGDKAALRSVSRYEQRIAELEAELVARDEALVASEQALAAKQRAYEKTEAELQLHRFDDETARQERVKRVGNNLVMSLPQVLADLQKFWTEREAYPDEIRSHLIQQSEYLANYLGDQLAAL
jgi:uncharacterized coiled-coil protein SlyX